jgi:hypothetical protein
LKWAAVADEAGGPVYFVKDNGAGFETGMPQTFRDLSCLHNANDYEGTGLANVKR